MLDIVVNSLYQNKDVFLRELISNASDALDKVRFLSLTKPEYLDAEEKLEVQIEFDPDHSTLTIRDTGIGMTHDDMVSNLGTFARSGTTKFLQALQESGETASGDISQIGQFGVGFYSSFLVADRVQVASKHPDSPDQYVWSSTNGASEFNIWKDPRGNTLTRGTEITLFLKEDAVEYASDMKLLGLAKHYSEFVTHPIHLRTISTIEVEDEEAMAEAAAAAKAEKEEKDGEEKSEDDLEVSDEEDVEEEELPKIMKEVTTFEWERVNGNPAIWTRSKEDITEEEYKAFWNVVSKEDYTEPEEWTHFNAEGNINFKSILYLPSDIPEAYKFGNILPEGGINLYVRKVLISHEFDLLPRYLGFIRGVVDSDDLPLNVNRETLQESKIIQVIKKKVVRKALDMIRQFAKESEETPEGEEAPPKEGKYLEWYKRFAPSLKMGAMDDEPNRAKIMKLLRFQSSKSGDEWISFEKYVEGMKDWQKEIFYVAAIDKDEAARSQFLETFNDKDVEVLFFTDSVDEYMVSSIRDFSGKKFVNIASEAAKIKDEEDADLVTRREKYYKTQFKPLTKWMKKLFGNAVMRVQVSHRLGSFPALVSSAEYGQSANMERIMRAQAYNHGQNDFAMRAMRVLEINPRHPLVTKLLADCPEEEEGDEETPVSEDTKDAAWILLEMALLNGGFPLSDPKAHSARMTKYLQSSLALESLQLEDEPDLSVIEEEAPEADGSSPENAIPITDFDDINMEL